MAFSSLIPQAYLPRWILDEEGKVLSAEHTSHMPFSLSEGERFPLPDTLSGGAGVFPLRGKLFAYIPLENGRACVMEVRSHPLLAHLTALEQDGQLLCLPLQQTYTAVKELADRLPKHKMQLETVMRHFRSLYRADMLYREHVKLLLCANTPSCYPVCLNVLFDQMQKLLQGALPAQRAPVTFRLPMLSAMVKADELSLHQAFYFFVSHLLEQGPFTLRLSEDLRHTYVHFEGVQAERALASAEGSFLKDVAENAAGTCLVQDNGLTVRFPSCEDLCVRAPGDPPPKALFNTAFGPYLDL
ncbi:MAG: hypothetical protein IKD06_04090 [Clostridia bacterium]|nr:hypothetical protein [Clostridia bacterium]